MITMLVDGKNCVYRAVYAVLSDSSIQEQDKHSGRMLACLFRFLCSYMRKMNPNKLHIFWDSGRETLWRRMIYPEYKANRERKEEIDNLVDDLIIKAKILFPILGVKMYERFGQEADDLIYAYCKLFTNDKLIIISSDGDFRQIVYTHHNVCIYNPMSSDTTHTIAEDVVDIRCLQGESGDNIAGYDKVGKVTSAKLSTESTEKVSFLLETGYDIYIRNRLLIDLSLSPFVLENMSFIINSFKGTQSYDAKAFITKLMELKIKGMSSEAGKIVTSFGALSK